MHELCKRGTRWAELAEVIDFTFNVYFFLERGYKVTLETQASGSRENKRHSQVAVASLEPQLRARGESTAGRITTAQAAVNSSEKDKTGLKEQKRVVFLFSFFLGVMGCRI